MVTINMDGKDRKLYFGIEEFAKVEKRSGKPVSELMSPKKNEAGEHMLSIGDSTTLLWGALLRFSPEFDNDQGWSKVALMFEDWLKQGNQNEKWMEVGEKIGQAATESGLIQQDKKKDEPTTTPNPSQS